MAVRFNERRLRFLLDSPAGPVGRHLARSGVRIESVAKTLVTSERLVRTGRYRASIAWRLRSRGGLVLEVGSAVPYARALERGTPPHIIEPRVGAQAGIFNLRGIGTPATQGPFSLWWPTSRGSDRGWVDPPAQGFALVHHPGTRAYLILHRAVRQVLAAGGSRTV